MQVIGITGSQGFLGWHLRVYLNTRKDMDVRIADRSTFLNSDKLREFVRGLDGIVHLAGMNRGDESEIESTNVSLTSALIAACEAEGTTPHIVFANSTHVVKETAYGRSKRRSAELLVNWAVRSGGMFSDFLLPGVFGEYGRPFYNSVVSTFCYQLAHKETPSVHEDREVELVHAQEVVACIYEVIEAGESGPVRIPGRAITLTDLLERLSNMAKGYEALLLPDVTDSFNLALFNTYRSYIFPDHYPVVLDIKVDSRGSLFESVKTISGGQCFLSITKPGVTRGNHYHTAKIERFLVIKGEAEIKVRRLFSDKVNEFRVSGDQPVYIDIPTFNTHNITNVGEGDMVALFWANEIFDPARPDTFVELV